MNLSIDIKQFRRIRRLLQGSSSISTILRRDFNLHIITGFRNMLCTSNRTIITQAIPVSQFLKNTQPVKKISVIYLSKILTCAPVHLIRWIKIQKITRPHPVKYLPLITANKFYIILIEKFAPLEYHILQP